jgi:hypothetical protein
MYRFIKKIYYLKSKYRLSIKKIFRILEKLFLYYYLKYFFIFLNKNSNNVIVRKYIHN